MMRASRITAFVEGLIGQLEPSIWFESLRDLSLSIRNLRERGGIVYFFGNGASASIASTLAFKAIAEHGVRAFAVTDHNLLLGFSRKVGFEHWIAQVIDVALTPNDLAVFVSSSGESSNVVTGARMAREKGISVFSLTGFSPDNSLRASSDAGIWVDSENYNIVESAHLYLGLLAIEQMDEEESLSMRRTESATGEAKKIPWGRFIEKLDDFSSALEETNFSSRRVVFIGDGSSSSLASHLATDFSKSGLTAQSINDHNFLSMAQNDYPNDDWLQVGIERSVRREDFLVFVTHSNLFPAEIKAIQRAIPTDLDVWFHGSVHPPEGFPAERALVYPVVSPVNELVIPSVGLLAVAEAFLNQ